ncbi:MAG: hypothetical protein M0Q14_12030 [Tissierellaceae bacterium]|nr:hypothetical protein [Tissierellaceae bacterium]
MKRKLLRNIARESMKKTGCVQTNKKKQSDKIGMPKSFFALSWRRFL